MRKKFSQYKFVPVEMIEQEMAITDNIYYESAYGQSSMKLLRDPSLQYKQLLGNFKTLFPKYILRIDQIQKDIQRLIIDQFKIFDGNI